MAQTEDQRMDAKRRALLGTLPQGPQDQQVQQQQQLRDLSQMRPQVIRQVAAQERQAEQVVAATWQLFRDAIDKSNDPSLRKAVRESSLGTLLG